MNRPGLWVALWVAVAASCSTTANVTTTLGTTGPPVETSSTTTATTSPASSPSIVAPTYPPTEDDLITATAKDVPNSIPDSPRYCGFLGDQIYLRRTYEYLEQTHPVIAAVVIGDLEELRRLLDAGADPNDLDEPFAVSALTAAIQSDCDEAVDMLLDAGADPSLSAFDDYTPVMWAVKRRNHVLLERLVGLGADVDVFKPHLEEAVAIAMATINKDMEAMRILIEAGADLDVVSMGSSPVQIAVADDWLEGVELLLDAGADPSHTAYYLFEEQDPTLLTRLLEAGADPHWIPDWATGPGGPCPSASDLAECFDVVWQEGAATVREYGG